MSDRSSFILLIYILYIYIYIYIYSQVHIYLDTGTIFIILAADQNIFKLYNEYGLKVHTIRFSLILFSSKLEERLRNYSSLICSSPLFQGTISHWIIDSKAISWTDVGYSFVISTSVKQVKGLELILSVPFALEAVAVNPHHAVKGSLHTSETDDC